jgi:hypothetical protein
MDYVAVEAGAILSAIVILLILSRSLHRIPQGKVARLTLLGFEMEPLGPGIHFVSPLAKVRVVEPGGPFQIGRLGTLKTPVRPACWNGRVALADGDAIAVTRGGLPAGSEVEVTAGPLVVNWLFVRPTEGDSARA